MTRRPKALIASLDYWGSPYQLGGHHIARTLVRKGWDVAYVSHPISPLHLGAGLAPQTRARFRLYRSGGIHDLDGHLWAYVPGALLTPRMGPVLRTEWLHRHWSALSVPPVAAAAKRRGFGAVDLLVIDSAIQGFWVDAVDHRRSVLRVADRLDAFDHIPHAMVEQERKIASTVDLVAYTAKGLETQVRGYEPKRILYLPNGVDAAFFAGALPPEPAARAAVPHPRAVYVGVHVRLVRLRSGQAPRRRRCPMSRSYPG